MKRTAVVILNWNTSNLLEKFLPDIIRFSSDVAEIIVADNASTDNSVEVLKNKFPSVRIISIETNKGFAGGYNHALKLVDAEYYLLLNSDVKVTENWLQPLIEIMENDKSIAACQPKILSFLSPKHFEYAGAAGGYIDKYGYPFCRGRIFNSVESDENQYDDTRPVFWATGACMMVRAESFHEAGGFDDEFFAHMEEIDLCWRMQRKGHLIFYCGKSKVYHIGGGTLHKSNPHKTFLNFRNNLLMIYKNTDASKAGSVITMRFFLDLVAAMKFLLSGSLKDFNAVFKARRDFNRLKSRYQQPVQGEGVIQSGPGIFIYPKSILWDYYLCARRKFPLLGWEQKSKL